jgi:hypothetical protein
VEVGFACLCGVFVGKKIIDVSKIVRTMSNLKSFFFKTLYLSIAALDFCLVFMIFSICFLFLARCLSCKLLVQLNCAFCALNEIHLVTKKEVLFVLRRPRWQTICCF